MVYIFGKFLNKKKFVFVELQIIYGLGFYQVKLLCNKLNIGLNCKVKNLSQTQVLKLCKKIDQTKLILESKLKNVLKYEISTLIFIKCFKSFFIKNIK